MLVQYVHNFIEDKLDDEPMSVYSMLVPHDRMSNTLRTVSHEKGLAEHQVNKVVLNAQRVDVTQ